MSLLKWVLALLMLCFIASAHAGRLQPFAPYDLNRSAEESLSLLQQNPQRWHEFLREEARLSGQTEQEVQRQLSAGEYHERDCHTEKCAMITAGYNSAGGVGYVRRFSKANERVSCLNSAPETCFSWYCVNPTYIPTEPMPPPPPVAEELWESVYVCKNGPTSYTVEHYPVYTGAYTPWWHGGGISTNLATVGAQASSMVNVSTPPNYSVEYVSTATGNAGAFAVLQNIGAANTYFLWPQTQVATLVTGTTGHLSGECKYVLQKITERNK